MKQILVVDDSELLHKMYDLVLMRYRQQGCVITHANNGMEALQCMERIPDVDLVLLDINMPVMSGLEFLQECQRTNALGDARVIVISTEGKAEDTQAALELGASGYLTKPFQPTQLHETVTTVMRQPRRAAVTV